MRSLVPAIIICGLLMPAAASFALEAESDESGWSWRDGLLGDSIEGDVFDPDDETYPGYLCPDCRDPNEYPVDYAAVAYNGYFGSDPWMFGSRLGMPFRVYDMRLNWVAIWFEGLAFDGLTLLPETFDIRIRLESGQVITITVLENGPDMPIGEPDPGDSGGAEADDDEFVDDDYADDSDPFLWEPEDEPEGVVEIIDPDEDGYFEDWHEEL